MLKFCEEVRKQAFFGSNNEGNSLLSNCFIETFVDWMDRRCNELDGRDHAPCCQASRFPFTRSIFNRCLLESVESLYSTPTDLWLPGVAGPKFNVSTHEARVVIIEYDAAQGFAYSHKDIREFYESVQKWFAKVIRGAPNELKGGFFVSYLGFFDVQNSLAEDTLAAAAVAMTVAVIVLFLCTFNAWLSALAVVSISGVILSTVGLLSLLGWRLNILESVAITLAIGLSVDFTLHYAIAYKISLDNDVCIFFGV